MRPRINRSTQVLALVVLVLIASTRWVRLNVEPSVAYGFYLVQALPITLERGMLVILPTPAVMRPWHRKDLVKPVTGLPGDCVCHHDNKLFVNGADFGLVYTTVQDASVPHIPEGCTLVPDGQLFLASPRPGSIDSRYFGPVRRADLAVQAVPLWTWP